MEWPQVREHIETGEGRNVEFKVIPAAGADDIDPDVVHSFLRAQGLDMEQWPQQEFNETEPEIEHDADSRWVCVTLRLDSHATRGERSS